MPIPAGFTRVVLHGVSGTDIFETGMWLRGSPASQEDTQTLANAAWNSWLTTAQTGLAALMDATGAYTGLRAYAYPAGGPKAGFIAEAVATRVGGMGNAILPYQSTLVVTLLTGAAGRRARGRMYLPASGATLNADHQFSDAVVDQASTGIAGWVNAFQAGANKPVVLSTVGGTARDITQTRADSKPDIQRRRANKIVARHIKTNTI
jgi:hypothetical protein